MDTQKKNIYFVPISGLRGDNITEKLKEKTCPWYTGNTLIGTLDKLNLKNKRSKDPLRIPLIDKHKSRGGVSLFGKIEAGTIKVGEKYIIEPIRKEVEIVQLLLHTREVDIARAGENLEVVVKGIESKEMSQSGMVICEKENSCPIVQEFLGEMLILEHKSIFAAGYKTILHAYTCVIGVEVVALLGKINKKTGKPEPKKPKVAMSGDLIQARFRLDSPICLEKYKVLPKMGRFTLREDKTVAIGKVTAIKPIPNTSS